MGFNSGFKGLILQCYIHTSGFVVLLLLLWNVSFSNCH